MYIVQHFWDVRELVPVALSQLCRYRTVMGPFLLKYDISIPLQDWKAFSAEVVDTLKRVGYTVLPTHTHTCEKTELDLKTKEIAIEDYNMSDSSFTIYEFGHGGDQNLHFNVVLR